MRIFCNPPAEKQVIIKEIIYFCRLSFRKYCPAYAGRAYSAEVPESKIDYYKIDG